MSGTWLGVSLLPSSSNIRKLCPPYLPIHRSEIKALVASPKEDCLGGICQTRASERSSGNGAQQELGRQKEVVSATLLPQKLHKARNTDQNGAPSIESEGGHQ